MTYLAIALLCIGLTMAVIDFLAMEKDVMLPQWIGIYGIMLSIIAFIMGAWLFGYEKGLLDAKQNERPQVEEKVRDVK